MQFAKHLHMDVLFFIGLFERVTKKSPQKDLCFPYQRFTWSADPETHWQCCTNCKICSCDQYQIPGSIVFIPEESLSNDQFCDIGQDCSDNSKKDIHWWHLQWGYLWHDRMTPEHKRCCKKRNHFWSQLHPCESLSDISWRWRWCQNWVWQPLISLPKFWNFERWSLPMNEWTDYSTRTCERPLLCRVMQKLEGVCTRFSQGHYNERLNFVKKKTSICAVLANTAIANIGTFWDKTPVMSCKFFWQYHGVFFDPFVIPKPPSWVFATRRCPVRLCLLLLRSVSVK